MAFIFDPSKGETPESIRLKRALAARLMGEIGTRPAKNVGEGIGNALASIGQGIAANVHNRRASKAEEAGLASAAEAFNPILEAFKSRIGLAAPQDPSAYAPQGMDPASARVAGAHGDMKPYLDALASIESAGSGDYAAIGPTHDRLGRALGRYQVMEANIGPWSQEALGRAVSPDEFLANPEIQDAVAGHRFQQYMQQFGSPDLAAQAWFAGPGGVGTNRRDVLGTSVPEYAQKFNAALGQNTQAQLESLPVGGSMQMPMQTQAGGRPEGQGSPGEVRQGPDGQTYMWAETTGMAGATGPWGWVRYNGGGQAPVQVAQSGPDLAALMQAASNPWLNEGQRSILNMLIEQQLASQDPMRQMEMERARLEIESLRNPQPKETDDIREYNYAVSQGYDGSFQQFMTDMKRAGATTVDARNMGNIPAGYRVQYDENGNPVQMIPIPGGPADTSKADASASEDRETSTSIITNAARLAREALGARGFPATGTVGRLMSNLPESNAAEVRRQVEVLRSMARIENLQAMRAASPTGGALGNVSNEEGRMLAAKSGALDPDSPTFARDLDDYERTLLRIVHGHRAGDAIYEQTRRTQPRADKPLSEMTDEELEAIINGKR